MHAFRQMMALSNPPEYVLIVQDDALAGLRWMHHDESNDRLAVAADDFASRLLAVLDASSQVPWSYISLWSEDELTDSSAWRDECMTECMTASLQMLRWTAFACTTPVTQQASKCSGWAAPWDLSSGDHHFCQSTQKVTSNISAF